WLMRSPYTAAHTRSCRCMCARSPNQAVHRMRYCALCSSPRLILCRPRSACWTWPRVSSAPPEEVKLSYTVRTTLGPHEARRRRLPRYDHESVTAIDDIRTELLAR